MTKTFNHAALRRLIDEAPSKLKDAYDNQNGIQPEIFDTDRFIESCLHFPPAVDSKHLYRVKAEEQIEAGNLVEAAQAFITLQATTLRHQFTIQMTKRINKTNIDLHKKKINRAESVLETLAETERQRQMMVFNPNQRVEDVIKTLPESWTVLQISCYNSLCLSRFKRTKQDAALKERNPNLFLVRMCNDGRAPMVRTVLSKEKSGTAPYLLELQSILKELVLLLKEPPTDRKKYWNLRDQLNKRLLTTVQSIENSWLSSAKTFLLGKLKTESSISAINDVSKEIAELLSEDVSKTENELKVLLSGAALLSASQIFSELRKLFSVAKDEAVYEATKLLLKYAETKLNFVGEQREPVILILDPELQTLPWESLPCLTKSKQAFSRIPSLQFLSLLWSVHKDSKSSIVPPGIAKDSVFYMVNPDKDLPKTQERLEGALKEFRDWEGLFGKPPEAGQLQKVVGNKDVFIYAGHGCGSKYLSSDEIERLRVRVVPLLFGCNSGELYRSGRNLEPRGMAQSYMVGTSPAVVGFLWPVTDLDVDEFTKQFVEYWLTGQEENLLQAVADRRMSFNHFVNAGALVVYGLPVRVNGRTKSNGH